VKKIILLTSILYFLLAPLTYHPDTKLTLRYPALENGQIWDVYGYINSHNLDIPDFHYPPAHFWWLKIHYPISKFIGGSGFDEWLASGSAQAGENINIFRYSLAAKLPLLILALLSGWMIFLIVKRATSDSNKAKFAAVFWYFNPITLYSLVIMGQNDIVAIFLFLMGILFYKKWWLTAILWGLASGVKSYPIIWAIMFLLVYEKNIIKLILKAISVIGIYGLILLPWMGKNYFTQSVLNSGLSQRMFIANIPIGFEKEVLIVPLLLVIIALNAWKNKSKNKTFQSGLVIFQSCLVILGFSHFNPQWMLWVMPFLSIWWIISGFNKKDLVALIAIFGCWLGLTLGFDDKYLTWGLLTPINPNLINFPTLAEYVRNKGGDISGLINLCQSGLAGVSLWYLTRKINLKKNKLFNIKFKNYFVFIPWILIALIILMLSIIKTENKSYSELGNKEIYLNETIGKNWNYKVLPNLKYFEISLDNPGLNSQDKGKLVVTDNNNNSFEKEFSGFNAGANSWLRVDVPESMTNSNSLTIETKEVINNDGLLKIQLDDQNRWAINFYNKDNLSINELTSKLLAFWWWWLILLLMTFYYFRNFEKEVLE